MPQEAFSYGLPVVATRIGAIAEIVSDGQSGYLVKPQNATELADRLRRLLDHPARCAQFGAHGRWWVSQRYSWDETGQRLASRIHRVARLAIRRKAEPPRPLKPALSRSVAI